MRKVVKGALADNHVHALIIATAQRREQVGFRRLGVTIQSDGAPGGQRPRNRVLPRVGHCQARQQGIGVVIEDWGVLARCVDPPD